MGGQDGRGVGLDQLGQLRRRPLTGAAHGVDVPAVGETGCGAHHGHEGEAFPLEVVQPVQQALARQRRTAVEQALGPHGGTENETAGPP